MIVFSIKYALISTVEDEMEDTYSIFKKLNLTTLFFQIYFTSLNSITTSLISKLGYENNLWNFQIRSKDSLRDQY